jgi:hypothetical protein
VKRFGKLYRLVCHRGLLRHAGQRVRDNTGGRTAGIDGHTRRPIDDGRLERLAEALAHNRYHPQAAILILIFVGQELPVAKSGC